MGFLRALRKHYMPRGCTTKAIWGLFGPCLNMSVPQGAATTWELGVGYCWDDFFFLNKII